jgi:DNA (cytosine-5)-methyltransferase 1
LSARQVAVATQSPRAGRSYACAFGCSREQGAINAPMKTKGTGPVVTAVDLFCGAGGLTYGLQQAGIRVAAGIDLDPACEFPFSHNNSSTFIKADIRKIKAKDLCKLFGDAEYRLLAGCAPCRPFSPFRRGTNNSSDDEWSLLWEFSRLVRNVTPELVTMENVPDLASKPMFADFVGALEACGYDVDYDSVYCPRFGVPQHRRRLVLVASRIGPVSVPVGTLEPEQYRTVRDAIGCLPRIAAGKRDPADRLHHARALSAMNLRRLEASTPGGTWHDWPKDLRAPCHKKKSGASYQSVYARMAWDEPSPTITTQAHNFGTGRFGHPQQRRAISLREAAILQTFPRTYRFVGRKDKVYFSRLGRLIGNAVPPRLARHIGHALIRVVKAAAETETSR